MIKKFGVTSAIVLVGSIMIGCSSSELPNTEEVSTSSSFEMQVEELGKSIKSLEDGENYKAGEAFDTSLEMLRDEADSAQ